MQNYKIAAAIGSYSIKHKALIIKTKEFDGLDKRDNVAFAGVVICASCV